MPMACRAKPTSRATSSVCSTSPEVSADTSVDGMILSRNSEVVAASPGAWADPFWASSSVSCSPSPGWMMLPTTRPMASANADMVRK